MHASYRSLSYSLPVHDGLRPMHACIERNMRRYKGNLLTEVIMRGKVNIMTEGVCRSIYQLSIYRLEALYII